MASQIRLVIDTPDQETLVSALADCEKAGLMWRSGIEPTKFVPDKCVQLVVLEYLAYDAFLSEKATANRENHLFVKPPFEDLPALLVLSVLSDSNGS